MASAGTRVKEARKARGMTQKALATSAGCSQQTIVDLERENVTWSRFMPAIADELGLSLHWIETGQGPRERTGRGQGAVPIVQWDFFTHAAALGEDNARVIDWAEGCAVDNSGSVVVVIVDDAVEFAMGEVVSAGDWLFIDRKSQGDGLVVVMMPGWARAEIRELVTVGTSAFLRQSNRAISGPERVQVVHSMADYVALVDAEFPPEVPPALVFGRALFRGAPL